MNKAPTEKSANAESIEDSTMVTEKLNDVFDRVALSRQTELLMDEGRGHAQVNTPIEDPRLTGRAIGISLGWREVLKAARGCGLDRYDGVPVR
jgi:hypothetical protein